MIIKSIKITNFRSIKETEIELDKFNIFVGINDIGKSNYLKALNLFFNNNTDYRKEFNFNIDFCKYPKLIKKKAPNIKIEIVIKPPLTYNKGKEVVWTRIWRETGYYSEEYKYEDGKTLKKRTKVIDWLKHIKFRYIPAIKGDEYFANLLEDLYKTLSTTVKGSLKRAGNKFMASILRNTKLMAQEIESVTGMTSEIQLPQDLSALFSTLDFKTKKGSKEVFLKQRGDGVKIKHIPAILKFIAKTEKKHESRNNTIWGYEEPENNLEMLWADDLSKIFKEYSREIQILITTHSPAFYMMGKEKDGSKIYRIISKDHRISEAQNITKDKINIIDKDTGMTQYLAPIIKEAQENLELYKKKALDIEKENNLPTLYVEGPTDVEYLKKAIKVYKKDLLNKLKIITDKSAGYNYVKDKAIAAAYSRLEHKVIALFDCDKDAIEAKKECESNDKCKKAIEEKKLKLLKLEPPKHIIEIRRKIPIYFSIEHLFPEKIITEARQKGYLEFDFNNTSNMKRIDPAKSYYQLFIDKGLSEEQYAYTNKIKKQNKIDFQKFVFKQKHINKLLKAFIPTIKEIEKFLD